jgi:hypothetical protein
LDPEFQNTEKVEEKIKDTQYSNKLHWNLYKKCFFKVFSITCEDGVMERTENRRGE